MIRHTSVVTVIVLSLAIVACSGESAQTTNSGPAANIDSDNDGTPDNIDCAADDPSSWIQLRYVTTDFDGDGHGSNVSGQLCSGGVLPAGYYATPLASTVTDCDDHNANLWQNVFAYKDNDADGFGTGNIYTLCVGDTLTAPGFSLNAGDCNDNNNQIWLALNYASRDSDADGVFVNAAGEVCSAGILPAGYQSNAIDTTREAEDCNDNDPQRWWGVYMYTDADNDGYGSGQPSAYCLGAEPHPGISQFPSDCNDNDATIWRWQTYNRRDVDSDGYKVEASGQHCTGAALPSGYFNEDLRLDSPDCDDSNANIWRDATLFQDQDGDGIGIGVASLACVGATLPAGFSEQDTDCDDTDNTVWAQLQYHAVDADADGKKISASGSFCTDGNLPQGYFASIGPFEIPDCNDDNAQVWQMLSYQMRDEDLDGSRIVSSGELCTNDTLPQGYFAVLTSQTQYDCNDSDADVFRQVNVYTDSDADGIGAGIGTSECIGNTLAPNRSLSHHDCNDNDATAWRNVTLYEDLDGDGIGSGSGALSCIGAEAAQGFSMKGYDPLDDPTLAGSATVSEDDSPLSLFQMH